MRISVSLTIDVPDSASLGKVKQGLDHARKRLREVAADVESFLPKGGKAKARRARLQGS